MNDHIRGILENSLDKYVEEESLKAIYEGLRRILKDMNSKYSTLVAYEYADLFPFYCDLVKAAERKEITVTDLREFDNWFKANALRKIEEKADVYGI